MVSPLSACLTSLTCLASITCLAADGPALPPVYWSASNPGFASSKGGIVVYPRLGDKLDIVCPQIPTFPPTVPPTVRSFVKFGRAPSLATNSSRAWTATHSAGIPPLGDPDVPGEYYRLFLVSREAALRCDAGTATSALLTCNRPSQHVKYTLKFQEFSPSVVGLEFRDKHDYYIISTSTGTRHGLARLRGGVCRSHGMRLIMRVGQA
uniref:ephrin-B1-like n=1 Tax=Myxine glutinosa TaxID=7769 RepID=UPI00358E7E06